MSLYVSAAALRCTIGTNPKQALASIRAGISRYQESTIFFVPNCFPTVSFFDHGELQVFAKPEKHADSAVFWRITQMLGACLYELRSEQGLEKENLPLFLGLPDRDDLDSRLDDREFFQLLAELLGGGIDVAASRCFRRGRASVFEAMAQAQDAIKQGKIAKCVVGGADSYASLRRLEHLYRQKRLLGEGSQGGFAPGEGAGCFLLSGRPFAGTQGELRGAEVASDPGHMFNPSSPHLGQGLSDCLHKLRSRVGGMQVQQVWAGMNGEQFFAKEWGVANLRHHDLLGDSFRLDHPAEYFGDLGAATGAVLVGIAAQKERNDQGPRLVWASSDRAAVGACILDALGPDI